MQGHGANDQLTDGGPSVTPISLAWVVASRNDHTTTLFNGHHSVESVPVGQAFRGGRFGPDSTFAISSSHRPIWESLDPSIPMSMGRAFVPCVNDPRVCEAA